MTPIDLNLFDKKNPLICGSYVLKPNEKLEDGKIICSVCGDIKREKKYSELFKDYIYAATKEHPDGRCKCELEEITKLSEENEKENFLKVYNCYTFQSWLGLDYKDKTFDSLPRSNNESYNNALTSCMRYCENIDISLKRGLGLYLWSHSAGTGKTTLMACVRNALISKGIRCVFINETELASLAKIKDRGEPVDKEGWFEYSIFYYVDVLILDDIGASNLSGDNGYTTWRNEMLYDLIEKRNRDNRCTLFTSNYSIRELETSRGVDFKTTDRITARASRIMEIVGSSYRGVR